MGQRVDELSKSGLSMKAMTRAATWLVAFSFVLPGIGLACLGAEAADAGNGGFLKQGMAEYNAGDYANASGHLGAALNTEFNNPVLHYYLASCYVHLNQKEAAVREFRIAFALQPDGDAGKLSKLALKYYGVDAGGDSAKDAKGTVAKDPKTGLPIPGTGTGTGGAGAPGTGATTTAGIGAPGTGLPGTGAPGTGVGIGNTTGTGAAGTGTNGIGGSGAGATATGATGAGTTNGITSTGSPSADKMLSLVREQVEREKRMRLEESQKTADQTKQNGSSYIDKTTNEIKENMRSYYRGRYYDPTSLPDDARSLLDRLKTGYDSQRAANIRAGNAQAAELDKSAQNLQGLLQDKARPGQPQLQPVGTSLYVRNYASAPADASKNTPKPPNSTTTPAK
jgi:hypothetical protein